MKIRKRLFEIIEISSGDDLASSIYDYTMMVIIIASLVPLAFKQSVAAFSIVEKVTVGVFIVDYLMRFFTADLKLEKRICHG